LLVCRTRSAGSIKAHTTAFGGKTLTRETTSSFNLLDTATDLGCFRSLPSHILRVVIGCFANQFVSLVKALLRKGCIHILRTHKLSLLCLGNPGTRSRGETSGDQLRSNFTKAITDTDSPTSSVKCLTRTLR
jgi:hypothetical protein